MRVLDYMFCMSFDSHFILSCTEISKLLIAFCLLFHLEEEWLYSREAKELSQIDSSATRCDD